jgi:hypothetical protein
MPWTVHCAAPLIDAFLVILRGDPAPGAPWIPAEAIVGISRSLP